MTEPQVVNSETIITSAPMQGQVGTDQMLELTTITSSASDQVTITNSSVPSLSPALLEPIDILSPSTVVITGEVQATTTPTLGEINLSESTPLLSLVEPTDILSLSLARTLDEFTLISKPVPDQESTFVPSTTASEPPVTQIEGTTQPSLARRMLQTTGSLAVRSLLFGPTRRLLLTAGLYAAGGSLIATFGAIPVAFAALAIWTT
jgi:hypothetical protein